MKHLNDICVFKWMNKLLPKEPPVTSYSNWQGGRYMLKLADKIKPGIIDWLQVNSNYHGLIADITHNVRIALAACVIINPKCFQTNCLEVENGKP
jgi:hypothetical protein